MKKKKKKVIAMPTKICYNLQFWNSGWALNPIGLSVVAVNPPVVSNYCYILHLYSILNQVIINE